MEGTVISMPECGQDRGLTDFRLAACFLSRTLLCPHRPALLLLATSPDLFIFLFPTTALFFPPWFCFFDSFVCLNFLMNIFNRSRMLLKTLKMISLDNIHVGNTGLVKKVHFPAFKACFLYNLGFLDLKFFCWKANAFYFKLKKGFSILCYRINNFSHF